MGSSTRVRDCRRKVWRAEGVKQKPRVRGGGCVAVRVLGVSGDSSVAIKAGVAEGFEDDAEVGDGCQKLASLDEPGQKGPSSNAYSFEQRV